MSFPEGIEGRREEKRGGREEGRRKAFDILAAHQIIYPLPLPLLHPRLSPPSLLKDIVSNVLGPFFLAFTTIALWEEIFKYYALRFCMLGGPVRSPHTILIYLIR
jgi:hypothetical protein